MEHFVRVTRPTRQICKMIKEIIEYKYFIYALKDKVYLPNLLLNRKSQRLCHNHATHLRAFP